MGVYSVVCPGTFWAAIDTVSIDAQVKEGARN